MNHRSKRRKNGEPERFYILNHSYILGCLYPECRFVFTESEINSKEIVDYIRTHTYAGDGLEVIQFEFKVLDDAGIVSMLEFDGWTPGYALKDNGFELLGDIDLFELYGVERKPYEFNTGLQLRKDPSKLKARLEMVTADAPKEIFKPLDLVIWDDGCGMSVQRVFPHFYPH